MRLFFSHQDLIALSMSLLGVMLFVSMSKQLNNRRRFLQGDFAEVFVVVNLLFFEHGQPINLAIF